MPKPDYSDIPGERDVFVKAWKIIEKYRHTPVDNDHLSEWDTVAEACISLAQCADQYSKEAQIMAYAFARGLMDYYQEKCKNISL